MKKRILALMLACFMVVSLLPMNVFATDDVKCPDIHTAENSNCKLVKEVAPTCNGWGYNVYECLDCGELFADDITEEKGDHVMETVEAVAPVCDPDPDKMTNGVVGGEICSICGWFDVELYPVAPGSEIVAEHDFVAEEGATCLTGTTYNCANCEATYTTEAGEHVWGSLPIIGLDPNEDLLEDGWAVYQCVLCEEYSEKIPVLHHECAKYVLPVGYTAPTCTETGIMAHYACTVCARTYTIDANGLFVETDVVIPALDHTYEDLIAEDGCLKTFQCIRCEEVVTEYRHTLQLLHKTDATCTTVGWEIHACDYCEYTEVKNFTPALGHGDEEAVEITPATCTDAGEMGYYCKVCGELLRTEEIPALGHDYVGVVTTPATCVVKEVVTYTCRCGDSYTVEGTTNEQHNPADMNNGIVNEATCTEDGNRIYYCTWCNERVSEVIEAKGHVHTLTYTYYDCAVWGEPGAVVETSTYCYDCNTQIEYAYEIVEREYLVIYEGGSYEENREAAGHDHFYGWSYDYSEACEEEWSVVDDEEIYYNNISYVGTLREATCTLDGLHKYQCDWCGEYMIVVEPAHGHVMSQELTLAAGEYVDYGFPITVNFGFVTIVSTSGVIGGFTADVTITVTPTDFVAGADATCTEEGTTDSYTCLVCGEYIEAEVSPALGHDIVEEVHVDPTCTEDGYHADEYCTRCGVLTEQVLPALGHDYVVIDSWMPAYYDRARDPGFIYAHVGCTNCGEEYIVNFHRHHFVLNEEESVAPTCTADGVDVYTCSCGFYYHEPVVALGHKDAEGNDLPFVCGNNGKVCAVCGEECNVDHQFGEWTWMPANCQNGEYEIRFCALCAHYEVNPISDVVDPDNHIWGEYEELTDENGKGMGILVRHCIVCGVADDPYYLNDYVHFELGTTENTYVPGSTLAVTITLNGNYASVWGFDVDVFFDPEMVTYVDFTINSEVFDADVDAVYNMYNDSLGEEFHYISVAAYANNNVEINEDVVVTLYFTVNDYDCADFELVVNSILTFEGEEVNATGDELCVPIYRVMDINRDGIVDLEDLRLCYINILNDAEYDILADADENGVVDFDDLTVIYMYILSN